MKMFMTVTERFVLCLTVHFISSTRGVSEKRESAWLLFERFGDGSGSLQNENLWKIGLMRFIIQQQASSPKT